MIRVVVLGMGMVASHYMIGLERIKNEGLEPYGIPLAKFKLPYSIDEIEVVGVYDVDESKVSRTVYEVAVKLVGDQLPVPFTLKDLTVRRGVHLGSLTGLPFKAKGLEEQYSLREAIDELLDEWKELKPDVFINVITTEYGRAFNDINALHKAIEEDNRSILTASQVYAYAAALYSKKVKPVAFVNVIPTPLANDEAMIQLYRECNGIVLGDDGATGATPLTADLLEHLAERNRKVKYIVQFNIGGNTDFLALSLPERNLMKEETKSSIVKDILGYDAPHFIKPTGYLEPIGDKKYVAMHIEYYTFNKMIDEIFISARINDSPALAGLLVDLARLAKVALDNGFKGTVFEINAFYMKKPGPPGSKSISKIIAYSNLLNWLKQLNAL